MPDSRTAREIHHDLSRIQSHPRNPRVVYACNQAVLKHAEEIVQVLDEEMGWDKPDHSPADDVRQAVREIHDSATKPKLDVYTPEQAKWLIGELQKHTR